MTDVRKGQHAGKMSRAAFSAHFQRRFCDPRFESHRAAIMQLETIAWSNYCEGRKAPRTHKAGQGFADPDYDLSDEWRPILRSRLEMYRALRADTIARFGEAWYRDYQQVYGFFVGLVEDGKLGGGRLSGTA